MTRLARLGGLLLMCVFLTACSYDTLYSDLDERQANEMLALLLRNDLDSRKIQVEKNWELQVAKDDLPAAVEILKFHGYPRSQYQSLGEVFKKEGFVSSALEERARLLYGMSQELSRTISEIDGVLVARVHLAIPEKDVLSDTRSPSSASIFIKHRPESSIADQMSSIKALVVNSVEGLPYDNVTVTLFAAENFALSDDYVPSPGQNANWALPDLEQISRQHLIVVGVFVLGMVLLIFWKRSRRENKRRDIPRPATKPGL